MSFWRLGVKEYTNREMLKELRELERKLRELNKKYKTNYRIRL